MPVSLIVRVVEEKYLKASSRPSLSRLSGDSELSLTLPQRNSAMARLGWSRRSWSERPHMYWRAAPRTVQNSGEAVRGLSQGLRLQSTETRQCASPLGNREAVSLKPA